MKKTFGEYIKQLRTENVLTLTQLLAKLDFAKKYFEDLEEHYKNKNTKISFQERIDTTQLATLIKNA